MAARSVWDRHDLALQADAPDPGAARDVDDLGDVLCSVKNQKVPLKLGDHHPLRIALHRVIREKPLRRGGVNRVRRAVSRKNEPVQIEFMQVRRGAASVKTLLAKIS